MGASAEALCHDFGKLDATADGHKVYILGGAFEKEVAHTASYGITRPSDRVGGLAYGVEQRGVYFCKYFI